ncbi:hypothetical protein [Paramagnetospirillum kuznetsovii]|nr:hypothetical protein [Paramagnetospirillum kuznetsovii]
MIAEFQALILAAVIEGPVAYLLIRWTGWSCRGAVHAGLAAIVATGVTHPQVWEGVLWAYRHYPVWPSALVAEALVVLVEAALMSWMIGLAPRQALALSLLTNTASFLAGLVVLR